METNRFEFCEIDSSESFSQLAQVMGGNKMDNSIVVSPPYGKGSISKVDFEKGLHMRAWEFNLFQPLILHRKPGTGPSPGRSFSFVYVLSPGSVEVSIPNSPGVHTARGPLTVFVISNIVDISFSVLQGMETRAVDITMSEDWMKKQFRDASQLFGSFLEKMEKGDIPGFYVEPGSGLNYRTVTELHFNSFSGSKGTLYLKARTMTLISDLLNHMLGTESKDPGEGNVLHHDKLLMVEKMLEDHYEKDLPSIEFIARQTALSESTLKRHFKLMFGKSIYECYLEKKMEYAKKLLLEKPVTVKEVAYRLGYEKTSNFIHIFKKFHSYSPGYLKKNGALQAN
jgi:AraC-like DNA-binding protein